MTPDSDIGLVLEGGGMRGVFTCGVLDFLLDHHIYFPYCVSVSAGACNGLSYLSRQRGRARISSIDLLEKYRYIGMKYLWRQHSILDQSFMYEKIPNEVLPYDYSAGFANRRTGLPCYLTEKSSPSRLIRIAKASSSLPFVCPIVCIDGQPMLDGGIVDSIPIERAIATGHAFNIVVSTRNRGFRETDKDIKIPRFVYRDYPRLRLALSRRHACYNRQLDLMERLEDEGRILVIRPERPMRVTRLEKDVTRLTELYEEGYACAAKALGGKVPEKFR